MGLMDFVGNAALTGNAMMGRQNEIDAKGAEQERLARIQDELQAARERTRLEMAQEFAQREEQRKRAQSADDGKAIQDDADKANRTRIADSINLKNGSSMTEEDARAIAANPEALKAYGLVGRYRSQEYDDKVAAAEARGLDGKVKDLRGQQDVEIKRDSEARRLSTDEKRTEALAAETARKSKYDDARIANESKKMDAFMAKMASGGGDKSEKVMAYMEGRRKEIASEASDIKSQLAAEMKDALPDERAAIKAAYQPRLDQIAKARQQMDADFAHLREKFNLPPEAAQKDAASLKTPITQAEYAKLPSGAIFTAPDGTQRRKP